MSVGRTIRIAVVDSQPIYRMGVVRVLRDQGSMLVTAEGDKATDALAIAKRADVDIMLLDTDIAGGWKQALASVSASGSEVRIVILSASESETNAAQALQLGARGFLLKQVTGAELVGALRIIDRGSLYMSPTLAAQILARPGSQQPAQVSRPPVASSKVLTPREFEIISQIAVGATNKEVARQLNISEKTVKHYMTIIMHKLQVRNRVEAVLAIRASDHRSAA